MLALAAVYVGSQVCGGCHAAIYASYIRSAMGQSLGLADGPAQLTLAPAPVSIGRFRVFRRGNSLYQSEREIDAFGDVHGETTYKLEYVVGSGLNGFAYIAKRGHRLIEAPLSYYSKPKRWDVSPGYENADNGFQRFIDAPCIACHSGRAQPVPNRLGLYEDPPFLEMAIGCENCHGPGGEHATTGSRTAILNPANLPPSERDEICARCHQDPQAAPDADLLTHYSSVKVSRCYRASGGQLSCTTCHDPHTTVSSAVAPSHYRSKCLTCHRDISCTLSPHGPDCAGCHMPKRALRAIPHADLTNHRIPIRR